MSLIERAAKRLEELRRSGVTTAEGPQRAAGPASTASGPGPLARVLDAPRESQADATETTASNGATAVASRVESVADESAGGLAELKGHLGRRASTNRGSTSRTVRIDLEGLKARGYVTPDVPSSPLADEFRVVKRPIIKNATSRAGARLRNGNLVMITSALPSEGKTFTAVNLAMSVAMELDITVLLVDGDVAHPGLPPVLGIPESPGLLDLLTDEKLDVSDAMVRTNIDKLSVLPAGTPHRRATELLASDQMTLLLRDLASRYPDRIIIFDSPPLLPTTEARVLATQMGQIVMVVAAEATSQNTLNQALATVEGCENVMMMLNKASYTGVSEYGQYPTVARR